MPRIPLDVTSAGVIPAGDYVGTISALKYQIKTGEKWNKDGTSDTDGETFSSFGDPVKGDIGSIVAPTDLVKAYATFAKLDGKPVSGTAVIFYNVFMPPLQVGDIGIIGREIRVETDQAGYLETMLVKGSLVDVIISGTGIIRRITVPTADFNIMSAVAAADDNFQIQIPDIPAAVRRS